jgi:hypothetical protein
MSVNHPEAGEMPAAPSGGSGPTAGRLAALAFKAGVFVAALVASLIVVRLVYALLGVPLQPGEMGLESAGWITALVVLMTTRPRSSRHWLLVTAGSAALIVAAALGAAVGDLVLQRAAVAELGDLAETALRIAALLVFWGPVVVLVATRLHRAGLVIEGWESRPLIRGHNTNFSLIRGHSTNF